MGLLAALEKILDGHKISRVGAALWFRAGTRLELKDLGWALRLLGPGGDHLLWCALVESGAITSESILTIEGLARFLLVLSGQETPTIDHVRLVWTLPTQHPQANLLGSSYRDALLEVIESARDELLLTSPFLHERGMAVLTEAILRAMWRGVRVTVVTHEAEDLASDQSKAVEKLRREAERLALSLSVYTAAISHGHLLHAKLAVADDTQLVLGSANLTGAGLGEHFEAGVVLGRDKALEARAVITRMIDAGLAKCVVSTST